MKTRIKQHRRAFGAAAIAALIVLPVTAAGADADAMTRCQSIEDDAARLACYDEALSPPADPAAPMPAEPARPARESAAPAAQAEPVTPPPPEPRELTDEVGKETLKGESREEFESVVGRVTSCRENVRGKYLFYFENGQVWQQRDDKRLSWDACSFEAEIRKDYFGYSLVRVGDDKKIRITRVR